MVKNLYRRLRYGAPVTVVSGLPRSGTSMAMKMLDAAGIEIVTDDLRIADEDNPKGYFEDERVKDLANQADKSYLRKSRGRAIKVISFLLKELPADNFYRVVFLRRDLDEVFASKQKMLDRLGEANETDDQRMRELWKDHLWRTRYFLQHQPNFDFVEVHYTEALKNPEGVARTISSFLGGGHDVSRMTQVVDPKLYRNRAEARQTD